MVETIPAAGGQDGWCGNFNNIDWDDDRNEIRKRMGPLAEIHANDLIGFKTKTEILQTVDGYPSISTCESKLLISAHSVCSAEEGHFIPSMECLGRKCQKYKGST